MPRAGMLPEENFQYGRLPGLEYIRVLSIRPSAGFDDPLECDIETVHLDSSASYTALSYSWGMDQDGDATLNRYLSLQGKIKHVTQNLFEGLLRLRADHTYFHASSDLDYGSSNQDIRGDRTLFGSDKTKLTPQNFLQRIFKQFKLPPCAKIRIWIDAVCINQLDNAERTQQVSIMRLIYSNASRTAVWLGEGGNLHEDHLGLCIFKCLACEEHTAQNRNRHIWRDPIGQYHDICLLNIPDYMEKIWRNKRGQVYGDSRPQRLTEPALEALIAATKIYSRRYFRRRWILQELLNSNRKTIRFHWGACSASFQEVARSAREIGYTVRDHKHDSISAEALDACDTLDYISRSWNLGLIEAFKISNHMKCADPRDRLYCLAGVDPTADIVPDYSVPTETTYIRFARWLLARGYFDSILEIISRTEDKRDQTPPLLPSWVPDLRLDFNPISRPTDPRILIPIKIIEGRENDLSLRLWQVGRVQSIRDQTDDSFGVLPGNVEPSVVHYKVVYLVDSGYSSASDHYFTGKIEAESVPMEPGDACFSTTTRPFRSNNTTIFCRPVNDYQTGYRFIKAFIGNEIRWDNNFGNLIRRVTIQIR